MFNQKEYNKKYYRDNRKALKERSVNNYRNNKNARKEYRATHKEVALKARIKHRAAHPGYINNYHKQRMAQDVEYRMRFSLRTRVYQALKGIAKSKSTMKLVGCTIEFLKTHLAKQFKPKMTWKNYGEWHVDHIRPCASFDLSKPSEQLKCFNYKNLQPLWALENLSKSKRWGDKI